MPSVFSADPLLSLNSRALRPGYLSNAGQVGRRDFIPQLLKERNVTRCGANSQKHKGATTPYRYDLRQNRGRTFVLARDGFTQRSIIPP